MIMKALNKGFLTIYSRLYKNNHVMFYPYLIDLERLPLYGERNSKQTPRILESPDVHGEFKIEFYCDLLC